MPPIMMPRCSGVIGEIGSINKRLYQKQNNKKENRESCVTVRHKKNVGVYNSNGFEVYNLWHAYVVMKYFTVTTKKYLYTLIINNDLYTDEK